MIKVLIVEDHELVRVMLKHILKDASDIEVIGEASNGREAVKLSAALIPDLILMDIHMPGVSGLQASRQIIKHKPDAKIIILTATVNEFFLKKLNIIGISGFLSKNCDIEEFLTAIDTVYNGHKYFCKEAVDILYSTRDNKSKFNLLTEKEFEIVFMLIYGMTVNNISNACSIDVRTVYTHKNNAMKKLGFSDVSELVYYAMKMNLYPSVVNLRK